ncbi:hypothetical protein C1646_764348 [Rhizophagus diaphanus]|nr:hypothetical protein C1646_764348 [Rhizophagus diaphanus] [Rhizophagus sp. MUCL 43196]
MIDLLDNSLPFTLEICTKLFRYGFFEGYLESNIKTWILFQKLHRHNYNKASLTESNTDKQIIQKAKTIDIERNDDGFKNTFINTRNTNILKKIHQILFNYHKECLSLLDEKCKYCFNYLSESIKTNITSLNKRLFKPLKDNDISEFTDNKGLNEDYDDENIDNFLEQEEYK